MGRLSMFASGLVMILFVVLLVWHDQLAHLLGSGRRVITLFVIIMLFCGIMIVVDVIRKGKKKKDERQE